MMDDIYPYPVFFECDSPIMEQSKRIENYFSIRRKSRGGVCGRLRTAGDKVFSISFKDQKVQQQVLQQCEHVVELADGPLVITVRGSLDPHTPTPSQDLTAPQQSISASTPPPSGEEYELQPDNYLLQYLKECPEAGAELEGELASVSCSAQLYPEEGRVLVKCLSQPAAVDEGNNWKAEVDKLFGAYLCHYEVDPYKVKALLQSCSSPQTTDEVKVYSEGGLAVVVGKHSQVNDRLNFVDSTANNQGSRVLQRKTRICRLGEAKLRLLWKEIEHGLGIYFPGVKVTQGDAGQVVLEGFVEDVLGAGDWVSDKENLVLERTVSKMSPYLLVFLRKAYGGPGVLGDFLGVGDKAEIELRDTELHVFSSFADTLDDAEKKLLSEFKEAKVDVPNCSALSSELEKKLKSKTSKMNQVQYRAQVLFGSDSTVSLLGHAKEVEELSEAVTQFILLHTVHLPFPELAPELPKFLQDYGVDYSGVILHPITSSSGPMVVLEGPSSQVTEVRSRLETFLDSLVQGIGTTDLLPCLREDEGNTIVASYSLCDGLEVLVCQGDITKQDADALVNAANEDLDHCGGVAAALCKAGGPEIQRESSALVKQIRKIPTGDVVLTTGGNLPCKKLLHAVGPVAGRADGKERFLLEKTVQSALNLSEIMEFKSIAMPCISSGVFGVPVTVCAEAIVSAVKKFGSQGGRSLSRIILIDNRAEVVKAMQEACDRLLHVTGISSRNTTPSDLEDLMGAAAQDTAREATAGAPGEGVRVEVVEGTIETQEVDALVSPMVGHHPLSTRVGNTLFEIVGSQLTDKFKKEAGEDTMLGDAVVVEGLSGLPSNAVFFLNLAPWDDDKDGTAVEILRLGINTILTSCESRGFGSVALPVLGAGIALRFPSSVVARVIQEQVHAFEQNRASRTPFLVRIAIHPDDTKANEVFSDFTKDIHQPDQVSTTRIVILGKTGSGKSNLANTIFGEDEMFTTNHTPNSGTVKCQAQTRSINGRSITLIDTPGFFDANRSEEAIMPEIMSCITECAPGPHAFLIVLKVDKFTEQEQDVIKKILQCFSEEALKFAVIVFTHGDQLPKGKKIEEFVGENKNLSELVKKCGSRCHVFDNKYWKNKQQNNYRSNHFQIENLLKTIDKIVMENNGGYYTNKMLQVVEEEIKTEEEQIKLSSGNLSQEEIREQARNIVCDRTLIKLAGTATGALLGAFFGVAALVLLVIKNVKNVEYMKLVKSIKTIPQVRGTVATAATVVEAGEVALAAGIVVGTACLTTGGVMGGMIGHDAAEGANTPREAAEMAANAVVARAKDTWMEWNNGKT